MTDTLVCILLCSFLLVTSVTTILHARLLRKKTIRCAHSLHVAQLLTRQYQDSPHGYWDALHQHLDYIQKDPRWNT